MLQKLCVYFTHYSLAIGMFICCCLSSPSGFVLGQASNKNANGKRKACSDEEENPCWEVKAKFDKMTYWNHDTLPSKDDTILRSFHWFSIAEAVSIVQFLSTPLSIHWFIRVSCGLVLVVFNLLENIGF